jgi:hypothetical protein
MAVAAHSVNPEAVARGPFFAGCRNVLNLRNSVTTLRSTSRFRELLQNSGEADAALADERGGFGDRPHVAVGT